MFNPPSAASIVTSPPVFPIRSVVYRLVVGVKTTSLVAIST